MNTEKLSFRLETVAKYIPNGYTVADIGSDHAYLPCNVVKRGLVPFAVAGEVAEGPFQSALQQVASEGLTDRISVRKGNGLEVVEQGEIDCITIAGMGGTLIATILDDGKQKLPGVKRLILQPNVGAFQIRNWFLENGWQIQSEEILKEGDKIYEVIVGEPGDPLTPYGNSRESELLMGPFLMKEKSPVFIEKWLGEKENWKRILRQLEGAGQNEETEKKKQELLNKIAMVEEELGK